MYHACVACGRGGGGVTSLRHASQASEPCRARCRAPHSARRGTRRYRPRSPPTTVRYGTGRGTLRHATAHYGTAQYGTGLEVLPVEAFVVVARRHRGPQPPQGLPHRSATPRGERRAVLHPDTGMRDARTAVATRGPRFGMPDGPATSRPSTAARRPAACPTARARPASRGPAMRVETPCASGRSGRCACGRRMCGRCACGHAKAASASRAGRGIANEGVCVSAAVSWAGRAGPPRWRGGRRSWHGPRRRGRRRRARRGARTCAAARLQAAAKAARAAAARAAGAVAQGHSSTAAQGQPSGRRAWLGGDGGSGSCSACRAGAVGIYREGGEP